MVDLRLMDEVTSAQAFDELRLARCWVRRPDLTLATEGVASAGQVVGGAP